MKALLITLFVGILLISGLTNILAQPYRCLFPDDDPNSPPPELAPTTTVQSVYYTCADPNEPDPPEYF